MKHATYQRPNGHDVRFSPPATQPTHRASTARDHLGMVEPSRLKPRYLRLRELSTMVPFSVPTIWRKSKDGTFVKPIKLSARVTAWNREAVEAWLAAKEAA